MSVEILFIKMHCTFQNRNNIYMIIASILIDNGNNNNNHKIVPQRHD